MVPEKTHGVGQGLHAAAVAGRHDTLPRLQVAGLAVFHPEMGHQFLPPVVAGHAVQDLRVAEIGQSLTLGNVVMAGRTRRGPAPARSQVGQMSEFQVHGRPRGLPSPSRPPLLAEAGVFSLNRAMALPAIGAGGAGREVGRNVGLGVASGAFRVTRKAGENPFALELVAKGAVGAKPGSRVQALLLVQVLRVGEAEQEGLGLAELGIGTQVAGARGLQGSMAHLAEVHARLALKVLRVAGEALSVARTGQDHRLRLGRRMAAAALQAQLAYVVIMQAVVGRTGAGFLGAAVDQSQRHPGRGQQHQADQPGHALSQEIFAKVSNQSLQSNPMR